MNINILAPGFRFHPTDAELIMYYLKRKILGKKFPANPVAEVDIYKYAPWDLPDKSCLKTGDLKWHFYCPISKKYGRGNKVNRANVYGYWKTTGKDRPVKYNDEVVGMIKTLVFHQGKAPRGKRTDWVMHEYRLEEKKLADREIVQDSYMLYVVFKKDGMGPKNGAQYGAPFKEDDWNDDNDKETNLPGTGSLCGTPMVAVASSLCIPENLRAGINVDAIGVHSHTLPLVGHTTHANADVNCTTFIDADAYTVPVSMDTAEAPMAVVSDSVPASLEAPQFAQYGAPFKEDDWNDDNDKETNLHGTGSLCGTPMVAVASGLCIPENLRVGITVDAVGVHSHTLPLVGHTTHANDDVNCTTFIDADADADAYTVPVSMDTAEAPMVVGSDSVPASLEAPQFALVPQDQELNNNNIVSMLVASTEDYDQMIGNVTGSFMEAANVPEEDDILYMLDAITEVDNSNNWCL